MKTFKAKMKDIKRDGKLLLMAVLISLIALTATQALAQDPVTILELAIPDTAKLVDSDNGIYVVGTSGGSLYVINEAGEYTVTALGAGRINDVRIEHPFIAVAAGTTVIELSLGGLTPVELWRTTLSGWREVVSTDLSEDGNYVCYLAQRNTSYDDAGEVGVLSGTDGSLISRAYASGWVYCNWWIDATGDMEYIAASQPMEGCCYKVGVALYQFDGSSLTMNWWKHLIPKYETTEVRISEAKDYIAVATSSGTFMKLLSVSDGTILGSYETPNWEQYACDGDDNLNYVIGANQAWSAPYAWFILENLGAFGYSVAHEGTMSGPINDLDSNADASLLAFGSDLGEFLLLRRSGDTIETVFDEDLDKVIDAIEIGEITLLVGGENFINLYAFGSPLINVDIKPGSCPNPLRVNFRGKGVLPVAILGSEDFDVFDIDITTITLEGVAPIKSSFEDVSTPFDGEECECSTEGPDGIIDLTLKFDRQAILAALEESVGDLTELPNRAELSLTLTAMLIGEEVELEGKDCLTILNRGAIKRKK